MGRVIPTDSTHEATVVPRVLRSSVSSVKAVVRGVTASEPSMDDLLKTSIIDRLEGWELVEYLNIPVEDVVEAFQEKIEENLDDIEELLNIKRL